ncbi:MAG: hypothetical protein PHR63_04235 [Methanoregulaceae archaeon]|nr:hypothetical protein [Methanoregulaceae archaeon]HPJ13430.1 hypothetical protein [Caldisericia bacterium]
MSLGIAFKGPEGIVLAADSRVTLTGQLQLSNQPVTLLPSTYDNATKLLKVEGQEHVGAVTYGVGAIGEKEPRTAHSYLPELEHELKDAGRLDVKEFAEKLSEFFLRKWNEQGTKHEQGQDMVFFVGGYDKGATYGKVFDIYIPSRPKPFEWHSAPGQYGLVWGGQREYADRLIHGFDGRLPEIIKNFLKLDNKKRDELSKHLHHQLQAPVPFAFLPLQDCVDLAIFLINTTIVMQHWIVGVRGVGGAIDVAVITQAKGFEVIQRKQLRGEEKWS